MSFLASAIARPRADLRKRLDAWAKAAIERLRAIGAETYATFVTDAAGGQRVAFVARRTKSDQALARLVLACDADRVEVGVEIQARALPTVRAMLGDPQRSLELLSGLDALPEQFVIGTPELPGPWARGSSDEIRRVLDSVEDTRGPLWLGWRVPRELAVAHADSLDEQMQDALVALGPLFGMLDLDAQHEADTARAPRTDRRHRRTADDDRGKKRKAARGSDRRPYREHDGRSPALPDPGQMQAPAESELEPDVERDDSTSPSRPRRGQNAPALIGAAARRRSLQPRIDPRAPIERGTLVRVLEGPFRGKVGVVQELDGKGGARVLLGLLAVRLAIEDVAACAKGRERPLLSSSHRKPLPARS